MATILGVSFYFHDSAAAIVRDGEIVAAAAEERFTRRKHTFEFPKCSIEYCLGAANLSSIDELDAIVYYEKPLSKFVRVVEGMVAAWPWTLGSFTGKLPGYLKQKVNIQSLIANQLPAFSGNIFFSEHHLSHAASAYFCSPFEESAIVTIDGVGERETTTIGIAKGRDIRLLKAIHFPHSIGLLYSALTAYLGFRVNDAEWKVMGLAPYGTPAYLDKFRRLVTTKPDGSFRLNMEYFAHHYSSRHSANQKKWEQLFGFPARKPDDPLLPRHHDLARSGQALVEEMIVALAAEAKRVTGSENLVIAGGVGLNSVANWRVEESGIFRNIWIQPAAGDDGGALGAALLVSQCFYRDKRTPALTNAYLGPDFDALETEAFVRGLGVKTQKLSDEELVEKVAELIDQGKVVGWARGRMEFGPRSLGSRSILASPRTAEMKEIVNTKVKYREFFRPFAPSVPIEHVHEYFDVAPGTEMPFMLKIPKVRADRKHLIPAVTHEDGTGRVQTVRQETNPLFHRLLKRLGTLTGVPVVLNTSFNVRGEPVVCSLKDAYQCFLRTGIDALVLGNYVITEKVGQTLKPAEGYALSNDLESGKTIARPSEAAPAWTDPETKTDITKKVLGFYRQLPFNSYSNAIDFSQQIARRNQILEYGVLHRHLKAHPNLRVIDVGCGAGWFVNSCAHYYGHEVTGLEINATALKQAKSVSRFLQTRKEVRFVNESIFDYSPAAPFDVINSLGVLHHTFDCIEAVRRVSQWLRPGGYLHLGLYHRPGRLPFLKYFADKREKGATYQELYRAFRELTPDITDEVHLESWFRDQVLHPHETQHTYEEIATLLSGLGFQIESTSIDGFKPNPDFDRMVALERTFAELSRRALKKGRYFPGYFVIWARKLEKVPSERQPNSIIGVDHENGPQRKAI